MFSLFTSHSFTEIVQNKKIKLVDVNYEESNEALFNPDRGLYFANFLLNDHFIDRLKSDNEISLVYLRTIIPVPKYNDQPLDDEYLNKVERLLKKVKSINIKIILRFRYRVNRPLGVTKFSKYQFFKTQNKSRRMLAWISPSEEIIKTHVRQLSKIINKYKDSISYIEAGFLGAWGEWHTDQYGDEFTWKPFRKELVKTLLNNLDEGIYITLRYPSDIKRMKKLSGFKRLGLHHDCPNTRWDSYPRNRAFRYTLDTPQGGEICGNKPKIGSFEHGYGCKVMMKYFKKYHFDTLRIDNLRYIINQGCFEELKNKLGYRFVLRGSKYQDGYLYFSVENVGFGKSFRDRYLKLKLGDQIVKIDINIKNWKSGKKYIEKIFIGKTNIKKGLLIVDDDIKFANKNGNEIYLH